MVGSRLFLRKYNKFKIWVTEENFRTSQLEILIYIFTTEKVFVTFLQNVMT